jgi:hypothetical protein
MTRYVMKLDREIDRELAREVSRLAPKGTRLEFTGRNHSMPQRSLLWAWLSQLSLRERWQGHKLSPDEWCRLFMHALPGGRYVPSLDGSGMVQVRSSASLTKDEIGQLIDRIRDFALEHGVTL